MIHFKSLLSDVVPIWSNFLCSLFNEGVIELKGFVFAIIHAHVHEDGFSQAGLVVDVIYACFMESNEEFLTFELFTDEVQGEVDVGWEFGEGVD
jgi:hypothetical protein